MDQFLGRRSVSCGEGYITNFISKLNDCSIIGIDIGKAVIKKAKKDYPGITYIQGSVYKLPFKNKSFDVVTAFEILEHLKNPEIALRELKMTTKMGYYLSTD